MLKEILGLNPGSVVSLVGMGGKSATMMRLAAECAESRVLITTTTKMGRDDVAGFHFADVHIGRCPAEHFEKSADKGVHFAAERVLSTGKIIGYPPEMLSGVFPLFDLSVIEADGSQRKPLKGWNENEPVIPMETTLTLGILPVSVLGLTVDATNVHNLELYCALTGAFPGEAVNTNQIRRLITGEKGLFSRAKGRRVLVINQAENDGEAALLPILGRLNGRLDGVVAGSAYTGDYRRIF